MKLFINWFIYKHLPVCLTQLCANLTPSNVKLSGVGWINLDIPQLIPMNLVLVEINETVKYKASLLGVINFNWSRIALNKLIHWNVNLYLFYWICSCKSQWGDVVAIQSGWPTGFISWPWELLITTSLMDHYWKKCEFHFYMLLKTLLHDAMFFATCNKILILSDVY